MPRPVALALVMVLVFAITILILANILPGPHRSTDYLVMGGVATMLCLILAFVLLAVVPRRRPPAKADKSQASRTSTDL